MSDNTTVATVDGESISRQELDVQVQQFANNPNIQTPDQSNEEEYKKFERAVLEHLINDALIFADAKKQGYEADQEAVEKQLETLKGQFDDEEAFQKRLAEVNLTPEAFKASIERQMIVDQYYKKLFEEHSIEATEEEIKKIYDEHVAGQENAPSLEDVQSYIKSQVEQQKIQQALTPILANLRESSTVDIKI